MGWVPFWGEKARAKEYRRGPELLASLRLCANVPGQFAVQTALGGRQSIEDLVRPGGRLYETRRAIIESVAKSRFMEVVAPSGALYAFIRVKSEAFASGFDDEAFALTLLEEKHILIAPGTSFNVPYKNHFRVTLLPQPDQMRAVMGQIDELLGDLAEASA